VFAWAEFSDFRSSSEAKFDAMVAALGKEKEDEVAKLLAQIAALQKALFESETEKASMRVQWDADVNTLTTEHEDYVLTWKQVLQ
jgi:hypothetical protein